MSVLEQNSYSIKILGLGQNSFGQNSDGQKLDKTSSDIFGQDLHSKYLDKSQNALKNSTSLTKRSPLFDRVSVSNL